jgi:hypothetical protein
MTERDEWSLDPSVQRMRRIFSRIEAAQKELLEKLQVSPYDRSLGEGREMAKALFERAWPLAASRGMDSDGEAAGLYRLCLAWALGRNGIDVPEALNREYAALASVLQEVLR